MAPIAVDPAVLDTAGATTLAATQSAISAVQSALATLGGTGGMTGTDPAGLVVGQNYDDAASGAVVAAVDTINGVSRIGDLLKMSAYNYAIAEHRSSISPGAGPLTKPSATEPFSSRIPPGGAGSLDDAPFGWGIIQSVIGMVWPNGDPAKMRTAADAWIALSDAVSGFGGALIGPKSSASGLEIPEKDSIATAFSDATGSANQLADAASAIARQLNAYAEHVEDAHRHLLNLINDALQLATPGGLLEEGFSVITGGESRLMEIADEAEQVLDDLKVEADAVGTLLAPIVSAAEEAAKAMAGWVAAELQEAADIAQVAVADVVNTAATYGNTALHNPLDAAAMVVGAGMIAQGTTLFGGGVVADATGVGAIVGIPANVVGAAEVAAGAGIAGAGALDLTQDASRYRVAVMHAQVRDARGRYTGYDQPSADKEQLGLKLHAKANPDRTIVPNNRNAQFSEGAGPPEKPNGKPWVRKFDGYDMPKDLKPDSDGYVPVKGIEVKSGGAGPSANQKTFDPQVSPETPAYGTAVLPDGRVIPVKVT